MSLAAALATAAPGVDPGRTVELGAGLWGRVVDLGDGTVVKLIRQSDAGLGDARDLWDNEYRALRALAACDLPFAVPCPVDAGRLDAASTGFSLFLRTTRLPGRALDDDSLARLVAEPDGRFAAALAQALAALHGLELPGGFDDPRADRDRGHLAEIAPLVADVAGSEVMAALAAALAEIEAPGAAVPSHGDVNSTNILVDADGRLTGLVDWAEARRDWREAELCHLVPMPEAFAPVRRAYEIAAGVALDDRRLALGGLHNALVGLAIARRLGEAGETAWNLGQARRLIAALDLPVRD